MQVKETSQGSQLPVSYSSDCLLSRVGRPGLTKSRWFKPKRFCISLPSVRDKPTPYCHRTCALESDSTLYVQFYLLCALFMILIYRSHSEFPGGSRTWPFTVLHVLCPSPEGPSSTFSMANVLLTLEPVWGYFWTVVFQCVKCAVTDIKNKS